MNAPSLNNQHEQMDEWQDIGAAETFSGDEPTAVQAQGVAIAVFRLEDGLFALHDLCTHGNARLSDGYVENDCVECPLHQGLFDIRSGEPRCAPVTSAVRRFPLRVVAGRIEVNIQQASAQSVSSQSCIAVKPTKTYLASVSSIERLAADVIMLRLSTDAAMPYQPGQYLNVVLNNGEQRSYSMANVSGVSVSGTSLSGSNLSGPQPSATNPAALHLLELHIRHLPGGLFSDHVLSNLGVGDLLNLEGPQGNFMLSTSTAPAILLASGTGFAPIKAMMEAAIQDGNTRPIALYWGGRRPQDLYLQSLCQQWSDRFAWFRFVPVLSAAMPEDAWDGRNGLVHSAVLEDYPDLSGYEVYACGAPRMIDAARRDFIRLAGLPADAFFADAFVSRAGRAAGSS